MSPLSRILVLAVSAAGLSAALTFFLIHFSLRLRLVAQPRPDRWHQNPTPNSGGVAVFLSCALLYSLAVPGRYSTIAAASLAIAVLGFLDDRFQLRPSLKFAGQSLAAVAVIAAGIVFRPTPWEPLNLGLTFLWITGITNAFNLIDNMDGLCAGVTVIISVFRCWSALQTGDNAGAYLFAMLAGAFGGFLVFNYKPARIFMGDAGSMFAGFTLAALTIAGPMPRTRVFLSALVYPALTFLYPIFDTALVSVLRKAAGRPISVGGRDHTSHRLASLGHSEQRVVWLLWSLTALGAAVGTLAYWLPVGVHVLGGLLLIGVTLFGIFLATLPQYTRPEGLTDRPSWVRRAIPTLRAGIVLVVDALLAGLALLSAFLIRWEDSFLGPPLRQFLLSLLIVIPCQSVAALILRTFNLGWRWFGLRDLFILLESALLASALSAAAIWMAGMRTYSRGVILLFAFLLFCFTAGLRQGLGFFWSTLGSPPTRRKAAVLGVKGVGELIVLVLQQDWDADASPVVVLETDPAADHTTIHGVPVRYVGRDPLATLRHHRAELLVVPANHDLSQPQHSVVDRCLRAGFPVAKFEMALIPLLPESAGSRAAAGL